MPDRVPVLVHHQHPHLVVERDDARGQTAEQGLEVGMLNLQLAATAIGAFVALLTGWWRPVPWVLVLALTAVPAAIWWFAVDRWLRYGRSASQDRSSQETA